MFIYVKYDVSNLQELEPASCFLTFLSCAKITSVGLDHAASLVIVITHVNNLFVSSMSHKSNPYS